MLFLSSFLCTVSYSSIIPICAFESLQYCTKEYKLNLKCFCIDRDERQCLVGIERDLLYCLNWVFNIFEMFNNKIISNKERRREGSERQQRKRKRGWDRDMREKEREEKKKLSIIFPLNMLSAWAVYVFSYPMLLTHTGGGVEWWGKKKVIF